MGVPENSDLARYVNLYASFNIVLIPQQTSMGDWQVIFGSQNKFDGRFMQLDTHSTMAGDVDAHTIVYFDNKGQYIGQDFFKGW